MWKILTALMLFANTPVQAAELKLLVGGAILEEQSSKAEPDWDDDGYHGGGSRADFQERSRDIFDDVDQ